MEDFIGQFLFFPFQIGIEKKIETKIVRYVALINTLSQITEDFKLLLYNVI